MSKHWRSGDKCLAAIYLAQSGLGKLDSEAAYRVALAAELIDAGVSPRELRRELGLRPVRFDVSKYNYNPNESRVPAGSGDVSGDWTNGDAGSTPTEGRSASVRPPGINHVPDLPNDAVVVKRPDGTAIADPKSSTGKLMAPPRANFQEVYAAGAKASLNVVQIWDDLGYFGTFDFQRDKASNTFYLAYEHASNYAVGVYMAGAGYTREHTHDISEKFAYLFSGNYERDKAERQYWTYRGWDDAHDGIWQ